MMILDGPVTDAELIAMRDELEAVFTEAARRSLTAEQARWFRHRIVGAALRALDEPRPGGAHARPE